jgi:putative endonuclease
MYDIYYVYILTTKNHKLFYTGFSDDVIRRTFQHKEKLFQGFTSRYNVNKLVYFEEHNSAEEALSRESLIKKWKRSWKIALIESMNPEWRDLYYDYVDQYST